MASNNGITLLKQNTNTINFQQNVENPAPIDFAPIQDLMCDGGNSFTKCVMVMDKSYNLVIHVSNNTSLSTHIAKAQTSTNVNQGNQGSGLQPLGAILKIKFLGKMQQAEMMTDNDKKGRYGPVSGQRTQEKSN